MSTAPDILTRLEATILARKAEGKASTSHTAALLAKGPAKCAEKFGARKPPMSFITCW